MICLGGIKKSVKKMKKELQNKEKFPKEIESVE